MVNTGSTSVKVAVYATPQMDAGPSDARWAATSTIASGGGGGEDHAASIEQLLRSAPIPLNSVGAVGHRIVHGADRFNGPVLIDDAVLDEIAALAKRAPLHNQVGLDGIAAARRVVASNVPHVAVFDTAFHRTMPAATVAYGGPYTWVAQGLRRFGFHGISHEWAAQRCAALIQRPLTELRLVTCHLGGGCSIAAIDGGRSVDTTMGFTPLDGVVMATRSGSVDPGLLIHLLRTGTSVDNLEEILERQSGLLGLSGVSADLRDVVAARDQGNEQARLAIDVFVHRVAAGVGSMVAALGGIDALVFTGGIGEHSDEIRSRVTARFIFLGAQIDDEANRGAVGDTDVSAADADVRVVVVASHEELAIARAAYSMVSS